MRDQELFGSWMETSLTLWPGSMPQERRAEYGTLVRLVEEAWGPGLWQRLPALVRDTFRHRGWEWNGIYRRDGDALTLVAAAGPPVCAGLDLQGDVGSSGMCWDAILMNQTLAAADVGRWPGYVSCDGESGLATAASLVCPIRDASGRPIAVWDLDSMNPLAPEDPPFFDRLFATLSARLRPTAESLTVGT